MQSDLIFTEDENQIGTSQKKRKRKEFEEDPLSLNQNFTMELLFGSMNPLQDDEDDEDYIPDTEGTPPEQIIIPEIENSEVIAKRTRKNVDLHNVDLSQLENTLPPSPSSDKDKEDDEEAYRNFLESMLKQDLPLIEEDENDVDFTLPEEEYPKAIYFDSEEYRNDRGVHVSKQEIDGLMQDMRSVESIVPININYSKRRKVTDKNSPSKSSSSQLYMNEQSPLLPNQYQQLKHQLRDHFQLLVQVFLVARINPEEEESVKKTWEMMNELFIEREKAMFPFVQQANVGAETPIPSTPILSASPSSGEITSYSSSISPSKLVALKENASTVWSAVSGLDHLSDLYKFQLVDSNPSGSFPFYVIINLPESSMRPIMEIFFPFSNPGLLIKNIADPPNQLGRLRFTNAEDLLLAIGLEKYGPGNFDLIQKNLLPAKTIPQIANRYKNMISRRAPDNPIKSFKMLKKRLLNSDQQKKLMEGVLKLGEQFELISQLYLPQFTANTLKESYYSVILYGNNTKMNQQPSQFNTNFFREDGTPNMQPFVSQHLTSSLNPSPISTSTQQFSPIPNPSTPIANYVPSPNPTPISQPDQDDFEKEELISDSDHSQSFSSHENSFSSSFEEIEIPDSDTESHPQIPTPTPSQEPPQILSPNPSQNIISTSQLLSPSSLILSSTPQILTPSSLILSPSSFILSPTSLMLSPTPQEPSPMRKTPSPRLKTNLFPNLDIETISESAPVAWSREEDRTILITAKQPSFRGLLDWMDLINRGTLTKTVEQIDERYNFLLNLFQQTNK